MLKWLHRESKSIVSAAIIIAAFSFLSRFVGLIRDRILAGEFGAGTVLDSYYAAFKVPDFLFSLIVVGSLSASFIPLFAKYYHDKHSEKEAWAFTNRALHLVLGTMFLLVIVMLIFAPQLAKLVAPGFDGVRLKMTTEFLRIMLVSQLFLTVSMIYGSVLQATKRFLFYSMAPILYNGGIIVGALAFVPLMGPKGLAWGVVFGAAAHMVLQIVGVHLLGYRYKIDLAIRDSDVLEMIRLAGPRMLGVGVGQIMYVLFTVLATTLALGSVTIFQFAYNIQFFPVGLIGVSYAIAAFSAFAESFAKGDNDRIRDTFQTSMKQIIFFLVPLTLLFMVFRAQIVRVVVGAGGFGWEETLLTADTLAFFALSFIPQSAVFILARVYFAARDTLTPLVAGLVSTLVGFLAALWLKPTFGVVSLGMAFSIASFVNMILLWVPLRQRFGSLGEAKMLRTIYTVSFAGIITGIVMQVGKMWWGGLISPDTFITVFLQAAIPGTIGFAVYALISFLLKSDELNFFMHGIRRKLFKRFEPEETVTTETQGGV